MVTVLFCLSSLTACARVDDMLFSKSMDLDGDKNPEQISLIFSDKDEIGNCRASLEVVSKNKSFSEYLGDWFYPDFTRLDILTIGQNIKPFIVVDSAGGAHSESRRVYSFKANEIIEVLSTYSDAPSITEVDLDNDGTKEIVCKMRNYDKDPIADSYEKIYKWNGERFAEIKR